MLRNINVKIMDWDNPDLSWAKLRDDWPMWQDAIQKEVDQLEHQGMWHEAKEDENPKRLPVTENTTFKLLLANSKRRNNYCNKKAKNRNKVEQSLVQNCNYQYKCY